MLFFKDCQPQRWIITLLLTVAAIHPASAQDADPSLRKLAAANGLFQRGLYKLAAEEYDEFLKSAPSHSESAPARYALAVCYFRLGGHEHAIAELKTVLADEKFPQRPEAMLVLAHAHLGLKQDDAALKTFDQIIASHAGSPAAETASLNRIQTLFLIGKKEASATGA